MSVKSQCLRPGYKLLGPQSPVEEADIVVDVLD